MKETKKEINIEERSITDLIPDDRNFNRGTERGQRLLQKSLNRFGAGRSILVDKAGRIIAGNKTVENATAEGIDGVIVVHTDGSQLVAVQRDDIDLDSAQGREMALADNATGKANLDWDAETILQESMTLDFDIKEWDVDLLGTAEAKAQNNCSEGGEIGNTDGILAKRFAIPPFSILDTKSGLWQERKKAWKEVVQDTAESREDKIWSNETAFKDIYQKTKAMREKQESGLLSFWNVL